MAGIKKTMHEFKAGKLHSGSKTGPVVTNPKQAIAIAMSEKRKRGYSEGGMVRGCGKAVKGKGFRGSR